MTNFIDVTVGQSSIVAIDEDGEIWILCGRQNEFSNLNLPPARTSGGESSVRDIIRPIKTNWMRKLKLRALKVTVGTKYMLAQTEDVTTGKKGVVAFKRDCIDFDSGYFVKLVKDFFTDYEKYFEIKDMYAFYETGNLSSNQL